jgi:DNA-3-methyladenine glycosylase
MFWRGGHAYVYLVYGMYEMFNIVTSVAGDAQAVLIRGAMGLDGWDADLLGPGKLAREMGITRRLNGADLTKSELFVSKTRAPAPRIGAAKRVGVEYAKHWKDAPLRFYDQASVRISKVGKALLIAPETQP